jgi:hypothetical protein
MRTPVIFLCATLAAGMVGAEDTKPVSIFVGPLARDGFVDADKGVLDSIKDIQGVLRGDGAFAVVPDESSASLKLYVVSRTQSATGDAAISGLKMSRIEASLRVGTYERTFVGESEPWTTGTWKRCAKLLVKDLSGWVTANRGRIP